MTSQYGTCVACCISRLYARMRMHMPTRPCIHLNIHTHEHGHTDQYVILIAFPQQQWFCECATLPVLLSLAFAGVSGQLHSGHFTFDENASGSNRTED
jgi:hypothetical protein